MEKFKLEGGTVIHIQGLPFYLVHDTTFEGHPSNIARIFQQDVDAPQFKVWLDNIKRPLWKRLLCLR